MMGKLENSLKRISRCTWINKPQSYVNFYVQFETGHIVLQREVPPERPNSLFELCQPSWPGLSYLLYHTDLLINPAANFLSTSHPLQPLPSHLPGSLLHQSVQSHHSCVLCEGAIECVSGALGFVPLEQSLPNQSH